MKQYNKANRSARHTREDAPKAKRRINKSRRRASRLLTQIALAVSALGRFDNGVDQPWS